MVCPLDLVSLGLHEVMEETVTGYIHNTSDEFSNMMKANYLEKGYTY